jgi:hypothetical protein
MEQLLDANTPFAEWLDPSVLKCATFALLERGVSRRGIVSSNPSEQFNSCMLPERDLPVCDVITGIVSRMGTFTFNRRKAALLRLKEKHLLVPRAELEHKACLTKSLTYEVFFNEDTVEETHASVRAPGGTFLSSLFHPSFTSVTSTRTCHLHTYVLPAHTSGACTNTYTRLHGGSTSYDVFVICTSSNMLVVHLFVLWTH